MSRSKYSSKKFDVILIIFLCLIGVIYLYPIFYTIIASFSDTYAVLRGEVKFWFKGFNIDAYRFVFNYKQIWSGYMNTIIYTAVGTVYALLITIPCAYAMSRKNIKGKSIIMIYFVFTMYFSGGLIPSYLLVRSLGMLDSRQALIIPAGMSVYNMIIARTFYQSSIPNELYEAAKIDGANEFRTFFQIALPLSGAIIAVIALYVAVGHWNSYFAALIYITDRSLYPLQLVLRGILIMNQNIDIQDVVNLSPEEAAELMRRKILAESMKYSLIIIASLPVLAAYPFVQKYFVKGIMIGALKG